MRLYVLFAGQCAVDKGVFITPGEGLGRLVVCPVAAYLVETDDGDRVLIDTGLHPDHLADPSSTWRERPEMDAILRPAMLEENRLEHQLGLIGLSPGDVTHVVNSHLHFDHCGQNYLFKETPILVSGKHFEAVRDHPDFPGRYFDMPDLDYVFTETEGPLFPGIDAIATPGHAPHHRSFVVTLPGTGKIVLCADAIINSYQLESGDWSGQMDPSAARESAARLTEFAGRADARLFFGHDHDQWRTLRKAPDFYE
jgi:N-acyl homoserine lactone hydrolase